MTPERIEKIRFLASQYEKEHPSSFYLHECLLEIEVLQEKVNDFRGWTKYLPANQVEMAKLAYCRECNPSHSTHS